MQSFFIALPVQEGKEFNDFIKFVTKKLDIKIEEYITENCEVDTEQKENRIQKRVYTKFLIDENQKNFKKFNLELGKKVNLYK